MINFRNTKTKRIIAGVIVIIIIATMILTLIVSALV